MVAEFQRAVNTRLQCLQEDGVMGPKTRRAFNSLPEEIRKELTREFPSVDVAEPTDEEEKEEEDRWVSAKKARDVGHKIARQYGLPEKFFDVILDLEPAKKTIDGELHYDTRSRSPGSGKYKGMAQAYKGSWTDAKRTDPHGVLKDKSFADLDDMMVALHVVASYAIFNLRVMRDKIGDTFEVTPTLLYVAHNQGAGGAIRALNGGTRIAGNQSAHAEKAYNALRNA